MSKAFPVRLRSFKCAFRGMFTMLKSQHNAWIYAIVTVAVCAVGFFFRFNKAEWSWIILAIIAVWTAESLNTAFEFLADVAFQEFHPLVEKAKDVAAGAVLISAIGAVAIGILVIGPHLLALLLNSNY